MNAPAKFLDDPYDALLASVVPYQEPEDVTKLRKRLLKARDWATRRLSNSEHHTAEAIALYGVILDVASAYVFRACDHERLQQAVEVCLRLLSTASTLDTMGGCSVAPTR